MRRAAANALLGWLCAAAGVVMLCAGTDAPHAHGAGFWWLKAAALASLALAFHLLRAARKREDTEK